MNSCKTITYSAFHTVPFCPATLVCWPTAPQFNQIHVQTFFFFTASSLLSSLLERQPAKGPCQYRRDAAPDRVYPFRVRLSKCAFYFVSAVLLGPVLGYVYVREIGLGRSRPCASWATCCCLFFAIRASICSRALFKPVLSCCLRRLRISYNVMSVLAWCTSSSICHASV